METAAPANSVCTLTDVAAPPLARRNAPPPTSHAHTDPTSFNNPAYETGAGQHAVELGPTDTYEEVAGADGNRHVGEHGVTQNAAYETIAGGPTYQAIDGSPSHSDDSAQVGANMADPTYAGFDGGNPTPAADATYSEVTSAVNPPQGSAALVISADVDLGGDGSDYDC